MHSYSHNRLVRLRAAGAACAILSLGGCMMQDQAPPALSGPSGFGISLTMAAQPAVIAHDGQERSTLIVTARDSSGNGVSGVRLVPSVSPSATPVFQMDQATGPDGTARFLITAPALSTVAPHNEIVVWITPIGTDYQNSVSKTVSLGLLGPSNATYPSPDFLIAPENPKAGGTVVLDASPTMDEGVPCTTCSYEWTVEGTTQKGRVVTYRFSAEGAYAVALTVTDATGTTVSITKAVEIAAAEEAPATPPTP